MVLESCSGNRDFPGHHITKWKVADWIVKTCALPVFMDGWVLSIHLDCRNNPLREAGRAIHWVFGEIPGCASHWFGRDHLCRDHEFQQKLIFGGCTENSAARSQRQSVCYSLCRMWAESVPDHPSSDLIAMHLGCIHTF